MSTEYWNQFDRSELDAMHGVEDYDAQDEYWDNRDYDDEESNDPCAKCSGCSRCLGV